MAQSSSAQPLKMHETPGFFAGCLQEPTARIYSGVGHVMPSKLTTSEHLIVAGNETLDIYELNGYMELCLLNRIKLNGKIAQCELFSVRTKIDREKQCSNGRKRKLSRTSGNSEGEEWLFVRMAGTQKSLIVNFPSGKDSFYLDHDLEYSPNEAPNTLVSVSADSQSIAVHQSMGYITIYEQDFSEKGRPKFRKPKTFTLDFLNVKAMSCLGNNQLLVLGTYATEYRLNLVSVKGETLELISELATLEYEYEHMYYSSSHDNFVLLFGRGVISVWCKDKNEIILSKTMDEGVVVDLVPYNASRENGELTDVTKLQVIAATNAGVLLMVTVKWLSSMETVDYMTVTPFKDVKIPTPTSISHFKSNSHLYFISSSLTESILFEVQETDESGTYGISVHDKLDNIGPIFDLCSSLDRNSNLQLVTCSNGPPYGTLKRIKFGAEIENIGATQFGYEYKNGWILSLCNRTIWTLTNELCTQFFNVSPDCDLFDVSSSFGDDGLDITSLSLHIFQVGPLVYQITRDGIFSNKGKQYYKANAGNPYEGITRAFYDTHSGFLAYSINAGRTLVIADVSSEFSVVAQKNYDKEIFCISADRSFFYISFWSSGLILKVEKTTLALVKGISVRFIEGKHVALPMKSSELESATNTGKKNIELDPQRVIHSLVVTEDPEQQLFPSYFIGLDKGEILVVKDADISQKSFWVGHSLPVTCFRVGINKVLVSSDYSAVINKFDLVNLGLEPLLSVSSLTKLGLHESDHTSDSSSYIASNSMFDRDTLFMVSEGSLKISKIGKTGVSMLEEVELPDVCRSVINYSNKYYVAVILRYGSNLYREKLEHVLPELSMIKLIDHDTLEVLFSLDICDHQAIGECIELLDGVKEKSTGFNIAGPQFVVGTTKWSGDFDNEGSGELHLCSVELGEKGKPRIRVDDYMALSKPVYQIKNLKRRNMILVSTGKKVVKVHIRDGKFTEGDGGDVALSSTRSFTAFDSNDEGSKIVAADLHKSILGSNGLAFTLDFGERFASSFINNIKYLRVGDSYEVLVTSGSTASWTLRGSLKIFTAITFQDTVNVVNTGIGGLARGRHVQKDASMTICALVGTADGGIYYIGTIERQKHAALLAVAQYLNTYWSEGPWNNLFESDSSTLINWGCFTELLRLDKGEQRRVLKESSHGKIDVEQTLDTLEKLDPLRSMGINFSL